ncbi:MAG: hypothetical protein ACRD04_14870 [Terriglobales bacterium]
MRKIFFPALVFLIGCGLACAQQPSHVSNFHGQIMDSMCAKTGGHSASAYKLTHTHTPKDCTLACVKDGSHFVLYNAKTKATYKLDNQKMPRAFAGDNVVVHGTYDASSKTIHVENITPAR